MGTSRRRAAALALIGVLGLAACTGAGAGPETGTGSAAPATPTDLAPYLTQSVAWQDCPGTDGFLDEIPDTAQCADVEVPVDYFDADSGRGSIDIELIRLPAQGESKGSLLLNPGGPGGSGFDQVAGGVETLAKNLPGYDIVGFDPRGVSRSAGFDCRQSVSTRLDDIEADFTPEDADEFETVFTAGEEYAAACRAAYPDWGFLGTASVARDVYVISKALGDEGINFYGISYGSVIGYELLRTYPDGIDRMILESVVDPAVEDQFPDQAAAFNKGLEELVAACAEPAHSDCGRGRTAAQVRDAFIEAARNVEDPSYTTLTDNGRPSEALVFWGMSLPLYLEMDEDLKSLYIDAIGALINDKDVQQFEFWGYLYNDFNYNTGRFTATDDIQTLVLCLDESETPQDTDIAAERAKDEAQIADIGQRAPLLAAVGFSDVYTGDDRAYEPCSHATLAYEDDSLPDPLPKALPVTNPGSVPVLVLGITGDTATPYAWAKTISGALGVPLVTQDTTGHGVYSDTQNQCTIGVVSQYLADRTLPPAAVTC